MAKRPTVSSISRARAEADFATWSMMAKLGSLKELPTDAQQYLAAHQKRLETMSEPAAAAATIDQIDTAYQVQMNKTGGRLDGPNADLYESADMVGIEEGQRIRAARQAAARQASRPQRRSLPVWLIFAGLVALVVAYRYLSAAFGG